MEVQGPAIHNGDINMNVQYYVIFHHDDQHGGTYSRRFLEAYGQTLVGKSINQNHWPHREYYDSYPLWGENKVVEARYIPELHALAGIISVSEHTHQKIQWLNYKGLSVEVHGNEFIGCALMTTNHETADKSATILGLVDYKNYLPGPVNVTKESKREIVAEDWSVCDDPYCIIACHNPDCKNGRCMGNECHLGAVA
jgi:hypothetical protein